MNSIFFNSKYYKILDSICVNISDSFVVPSNKTGSGNGETRLYISSQNSQPFFKFSSTLMIENRKKHYYACEHKCFLLKSNLKSYLESAKLDYIYSNDYYTEDLSLLYHERLNDIENLDDEIFFNIYNQNGDLDSSRSYIGCGDEAWNLIRTISLPNITNLSIFKLSHFRDQNDILYFFQLNYIEDEKIIDNSPILDKKLFYVYNMSEINIKIMNDTTLTSTEKSDIIRARIGYGKFRDDTLNIMNTCPFTGVSDDLLLRSFIQFEC